MFNSWHRRKSAKEFESARKEEEDFLSQVQLEIGLKRVNSPSDEGHLVSLVTRIEVRQSGASSAQPQAMALSRSQSQVGKQQPGCTGSSAQPPPSLKAHVYEAVVNTRTCLTRLRKREAY